MRFGAFLLPMLLAGPALPAPPEGAIQAPPGTEKWTAGGPSMPPGTQIAVLEGDPKKSGMFTLRLRVPAGTRIAPHWHPRDERVTVLSGLVVVGFGDVADAAKGARFPAGSFYLNPALSHHYLFFPEESRVQLTGEGPWELHFVSASAAPK